MPRPVNGHVIGELFLISILVLVLAYFDQQRQVLEQMQARCSGETYQQAGGL